MIRNLFLLAGVLGAGACRMAPASAPVPVQGAEEDVSAFSGEWGGRYRSKATGRHGTIRFTLPEHADTGFGEVEITFSPSLHLARDASSNDLPTEQPNELLPQPCTVIGITVVRIEDDQVRGTMAPYWDPDCDCRAYTVFEGKLARDRITGTFSSRREASDRSVVTGDWRAERTKQ
ncbi:MAG TPA: hypothetical protein VJ808_12770 [Gemmatimonadales bacterium]|nr:hypothetical protein [Gemmatimonadales bacterium]